MLGSTQARSFSIPEEAIRRLRAAEQNPSSNGTRAISALRLRRHKADGCNIFIMEAFRNRASDGADLASGKL